MVAPFVNFNVSPKRLLLQSEISLLEIRFPKHHAVDVCLHTDFLWRLVLLLLWGVYLLLQACLWLDEDRKMPRLLLTIDVVFWLDEDQALLGELLPLSLLT